MPAHYGYVKGTMGADGDQVDVYVGDKPASTHVFVVDQKDPATGAFDEHKAMLGFDTRAEALAAYDGGFSDGSGPSRRGNVTYMTADEFKQQVRNGDMTTPIADHPDFGMPSVTDAAPAVASTVPAGTVDPALIEALNTTNGNLTDTKNIRDKWGPQSVEVRNGRLEAPATGSNDALWSVPTSQPNLRAIVPSREVIRDWVKTWRTEPTFLEKHLSEFYDVKAGASFRIERAAVVVTTATGGYRVVQRGILSGAEKALTASGATPNQSPTSIGTQGGASGGTGSPASNASKPMSDAEHQAVWDDRAFQAATKSLPSSPHSSSPVAREITRGYRDGKAGNIAALNAEVDGLEAGIGGYKATGFNPRQGYVEGYYAAHFGNARAIRALGVDKTIGIGDAIGDIESNERQGDFNEKMPAELADTAPASTATIKPISDKAIVVTGASPAEHAAIKAALPAAVVGMPHKPTGGLMFSKKHEDKIREALNGAAPSAADIKAVLDARTNRLDPASGRPATATVVKDLGRDDGRYSVATGTVLRSASGRTLAPAPTFDDSTPIKAKLSLARQREWLVGEAQKEVQSGGGMSGTKSFVNSLTPKNLSPSDWDIINETLFGHDHGPNPDGSLRASREAAGAADRLAKARVRGASDFSAGKSGGPTEYGGPELMAWREGFREAQAKNATPAASSPAPKASLSVEAIKAEAMKRYGRNGKETVETYAFGTGALNRLDVRNGLGDAKTRAVFDEGKAWAAEQSAAPSPAPKAAFAVGDRVTFSKDVEYLTAGKEFVVRSIGNGGEVFFRDEANDSGTSIAAWRAKQVLADGTATIAPKETASAGGRASTAVTERGTQINTRLEAVDAHTLISSDHPNYDAALQPRDRAGRAQSAAQVAEIAGRLDPERLGDNRLASQGAPIVGPDNMVESGNGRTMAIREAYASHPARAAAYRAMIEAQGHDTTGMKNPVLIRRRTSAMTPPERLTFVQEANEDATSRMSGPEQAKVDASRIDNVIDLYRGGEITSAGNSDFRRAFSQATVSSAERGQFMDKHGALSADGQVRIKRALLVKAYGDSPTIAGLAESTDVNIKAIAALTEVAPRMAVLRRNLAQAGKTAEYDIGERIAEMASLISKARDEGVNVSALLAQQDAFSDGVDPVTEDLVRLAFKDGDTRKPRGASKLAEALTFYADEVDRALDRVQQGDGLFGGEPASTNREIINAASKRVDGPAVHQGDIFNRPAAESVGSGPSSSSGQASDGPGGSGDGSKAQSEGVGPEPKPKRPSDYGAKNKFVSPDRAAELRAKLKAKLDSLTRQANSGLDTELIQLGTELAVFHIEAGARRFADFARAMSGDLGKPITDLRTMLRGWYNGARDFMEDNGEPIGGMDGPEQVRNMLKILVDDEVRSTEMAADTTGRPAEAASDVARAPTATGTEPARLRDAFAKAFADGKTFKSITEARAIAAEVLGRPVKGGTDDAKMVDEAVEAGVVKAGIAIADEGDSRAGYDKAVALYAAQPSLNVRTSESVSDQAYSTPVPLAYAASHLAGIGARARVSVYEPSAGNGMLLIGTGDGNYVTANEINPARAEAIQALYPNADVKTKDASDYRPGRSYDVVIANPPFGALRDANGQTIRHDVSALAPRLRENGINTYSTNEIDHAIAFNALETMRADGKAVLIVGGVNKLATGDARADGYAGKAKREFYTALYRTYNVVDHFTVSGDLYAKQGAAWPVDVITIHGTGKSALPLPAVSPPPILTSWEQIGEQAYQPLNDAATVRASDGARPDQVASGRPNSGDAANSGGGRAPTPGGQRPTVDQGATGPSGVRGSPADGEPDGGRGVQSEPAGGPRAGADGRSPDRPVPNGVPSERVAPQVEGANDRQVAYAPASKAKGLDTLTPVNMGTAIGIALDRLTARVGPVDSFVSDRLGYDPKNLGKAFSAEQVDALALALDNMDKGSAFIIGDQTGIGKGRVVAGVLRYAIKQGLTPIFVTETPALYTDIHRDLTDIALPDMLGREPIYAMTNASQTVPLGDGAVLKSSNTEKHNELLRKIAMGEHKVDLLFTTYSQMQMVAGQQTMRQMVLARLAPNAIIVFDESHNAGGTAAVGRGGETEAPTGRAGVARALAKAAHAVLFSSATYAKRPDVMDLYARTDMALAVNDPKDLGALIARGGVPMQQIVAAKLAQAGQYIRRERSFDGIKYDTPLVPVDRAAYDGGATALAAIQKFSEEGMEDAVNVLSDQIRAEGAGMSVDGSVGSAGAKSTNFTSVMHNLIDQFLLALKADAAADAAIAAIKRGEKPVITVANTLEAFLDDEASTRGIKVGDEMEGSFRALLMRYLERTRTVSVKEAFADKGIVKKVYLSDSQLGAHGLAVYRAARAAIMAAPVDDLPLSPLDHIRARVEAAGYSISEITGRGLRLDYRDGSSFLAARGDKERSIAGRRASINNFNDGAVDALLINRSASTGISLHASEKFADQRKRFMVLAQPEKNIDTHMQLLGRVNRTGQVVKPDYAQLVADIPAEKRPAAVLAKKMASLNANTTGARGSALTSENAPDFLNIYGDLIATQMLIDDPDLYDALGGDMLKEDSQGNAITDDVARKMTGRIPLLPLARQEEVYEHLESNYRALIAEKDAMGENALEAKTIDLQAKTKAVSKIAASTGPSPFQEGVSLETIDAKRMNKPPSSDAVVGVVADELDGEAGEGTSAQRLDRLATQGLAVAQLMATELRRAVAAYKDTVISAIKDDEARGKRADDLAVSEQKVRNTLAVAYPGAEVRLKTDSGNFYGVVTGVENKGTTKNPASLGGWQMKVLTTEGQKLTMPFSRAGTSESSAIIVERDPRFNGERVIDTFDRALGTGRETRSIYTGNIMTAFDLTDGKGSIVNFTDESGAVRQGLLMQKGYDAGKELAKKPVMFKTSEQVVAFLMKNGVPIGPPGVKVVRQSGGFALEVPSSKATGGKYFLDQRVITAAGRGFVKQGNAMKVWVPVERINNTLAAMMKAGATFSATANKDLAREITGTTVPAPKSAPDEKASLIPQSESATSADDLARTPAEIEAMANALTARLRAVGIDDKVALKLVQTMRSSQDGRALTGVQGTYFRGLIQVALDARSGVATLNHEIIHALRDLGLFKPPEWRALERAVRADSARMAEVRQRYADRGLTEDELTEEAVADMFGDWSANRADNPTKPIGFLRDAWQRVKSFLSAVHDALMGRGYHSADSVFGKIERGEVGARKADERPAPRGDGERYAATDQASPFAGGEEDRDFAAGAVTRLTDAMRERLPSREAIGEHLDRWRTALQDRFLPVLRVEEKLAAAMERNLGLTERPYLAEELMTGRVGARLARLTDEHVGPLYQAMTEHKVSVDDLEAYLYARHAPERNARIAEINDKFADGGGSGMTDEQAAGWMADFERSGNIDAYEALANRVDAMLSESVNHRVEDGLLSPNEAEAWRAQYEHYVPLRGRSDLLDNDRPRVGSGVSVRGKESRRAMGRVSKAGDVLAYSIMQAQESIIRGETNRVGQAFLELAKAAPDPLLWKVDKIERRATWNSASQSVVYRSSSRIAADDADYTVSAKVDGEEHRVTMNRSNPQAIEIAKSMRRLDERNSHVMVRYLGKLNRWLSLANTTLSPDFLVRNAFRDMQEAMINLQAFEGDMKGIAKQAAKGYFPALVASIRGEFGLHGDGVWDRAEQEFKDAGGRVYFSRAEDVAGIAARIKRELAALQPGTSPLKIIKIFYGYVEHLNGGVENGIRLSSFKAARDHGMGTEEAASLAKNLTINFNRRGTWGPALNAAYLFYNASVQGNAVVFRSMQSSRVRKVVAGIIIAGLMLDLLNRQLTDKDDDGETFYDKIPEWEKQRNGILMLPGTKGGYLKLPLSYGYNNFLSLGRNMGEGMNGRPFREIAASAVTGLADSFNPVGGGSSLLDMITPTVAKPAEQLATNADYSGKPIYPQEFPGPHGSETQRYYNSVSPIWREVSAGLGTATGGDRVRPGAVDISPNVLSYMFGTYTGGAGQFLDRSAGLAAKIGEGDAIGPNDIPMVRALAGSKSSWVDKSIFYNHAKDIEQARFDAREYGKLKDAAGHDYMLDHRTLIGLAPRVAMTKKLLGGIRHQRAQEGLTTEDKAKIDEREARIIGNFNTIYNKRVEAANASGTPMVTTP
jgi:hypothetical protein